MAGNHVAGPNGSLVALASCSLPMQGGRSLAWQHAEYSELHEQPTQIVHKTCFQLPRRTSAQRCCLGHPLQAMGGMGCQSRHRTCSQYRAAARVSAPALLSHTQPGGRRSASGHSASSMRLHAHLSSISMVHGVIGFDCTSCASSRRHGRSAWTHKSLANIMQSSIEVPQHIGCTPCS